MTADAVENLTDERDRYKAEIRNVMGLLRIVVAERDRYREALEQANLALIEARNPGIDMEAVKRQRSAALAPNTEEFAALSGEFPDFVEQVVATQMARSKHTGHPANVAPNTEGEGT